MERISPFTVTEKVELLALHRALFEAQFSESPHDKDVPGSPLLASMANRIVDLLSQDDPRWADWRIASRHPARVQIARTRLISDPKWIAMPREEKEMRIRNHLAPLIPDEAFIVELINGAA
ncbi:MAG TPA: hypothetical protein VFF89_01635 [Sphingobium sp.]|nr:hypothetical protein [Sphingobium sp.]